MADNNEKQNPKKQLNTYIRFSGLAFQMALTIIICLAVGLLLDAKLFKSERKIGAAILSVFGVIASIINLIKQVNHYKNET